MKIENVHLITFSPTHTSKRVGEAIVRGLGIENSKKVDLTFQALDEYEIPTTDLALISVPVYGGKVAPLALQRLEGIRSNGAPVVLVVVYGNRAYEKALQQLDAFVTERGFKVISGGTFIGEHSYSTLSNPIAVGRPDADDLQFAEEYGQKLLFKIEQNTIFQYMPMVYAKFLFSVLWLVAASKKIWKPRVLIILTRIVFQNLPQKRIPLSKSKCALMPTVQVTHGRHCLIDQFQFDELLSTAQNNPPCESSHREDFWLYK